MTHPHTALSVIRQELLMSPKNTLFTFNRAVLEDATQPDPRVTALVDALQKAVADYGKPGGPWNVPNEPGAWIAMAHDALAPFLKENQDAD